MCSLGVCFNTQCVKGIAHTRAHILTCTAARGRLGPQPEVSTECVGAARDPQFRDKESEAQIRGRGEGKEAGQETQLALAVLKGDLGVCLGRHHDQSLPIQNVPTPSPLDTSAGTWSGQGHKVVLENHSHGHCPRGRLLEDFHL